MFTGTIVMAAAASVPQTVVAQPAAQQTAADEELQQPERGQSSDAPDIIVTGRRVNLIGTAITASEGRVGCEEIRVRPLLRSGDLLELVPGLVATQRLFPRRRQRPHQGHLTPSAAR